LMARQELIDYLSPLQRELHIAVNATVRERPQDPIAFVSQLLDKVGATGDIVATVNQLSGSVQFTEHENLKESQWGNVKTTHKRTLVQQVIESRKSAAHDIVAKMKETTYTEFGRKPYMPGELQNALFCGHLVTDLDSIAGAIGASLLYGGQPARASEINSETKFALDYFGVALPPPIEESLKCSPDANVCLVDHQQRSQLNPAITESRICGIIDHHALQSQTIVTNRPIVIDIRPWGSMSTIVAHHFMMIGRKPPKPIAGILLCAILSDTLNLAGPTTTEHDRAMVAVLTQISEVDEIQELVQQQFRAKSKELAGLSAHQLVVGDLKEFVMDDAGSSAGSSKIGFAVVETTDDSVILDRHDELLDEINEVREEMGLDALFLAVVNIVLLKSTLLLAGPVERSLAEVAFGGSTYEDGFLMDLGARVSRKKEFVPPLTEAFAKGWTKPMSPAGGRASVGVRRQSTLTVDPNDPYGRVSRVLQDLA